jgi:hypothetical protein
MYESNAASDRGAENKDTANVDFLQKRRRKRHLIQQIQKCVSSKNSSKAVKFDKGRQPLVLQCVPRLGVASQASFVSNERLQGKNERIQHAASLKVS